MHKPNLKVLFKTAGRVVSKHSPEILTGIGVAGMITSTILAVRATPKALVLIEEAKKAESTDELTPIETVKVAWKPYIPAIVTGVAAAACIIGATSTSIRRNAALATAYKLSETALTEYREKVIETIGEKKEQVVTEKVSHEQIKKNPLNSNEIIITEKGNTLFLDPLSKRYFKSDIEKIKRAENELNRQMLHDMFGYVSVNELYSEIGLEETDVGDDLGWNTDQLLDIDFTPHLTDDGQPCIVLNYRVAPRYNYTM